MMDAKWIIISVLAITHMTAAQWPVPISFATQYPEPLVDTTRIIAQTPPTKSPLVPTTELYYNTKTYPAPMFYYSTSGSPFQSTITNYNKDTDTTIDYSQNTDMTTDYNKYTHTTTDDNKYTDMTTDYDKYTDMTTDYNKDTDTTNPQSTAFPTKTNEQTKSTLPYFLKSTLETETTLETTYLSTSFNEASTETTTPSPLSDTTAATTEETTTASAKPNTIETSSPSPPPTSASTYPPTKHLSTSTTGTSTKQITTPKSFTTVTMSTAKPGSKITLDEILFVFNGIENERYFQRLPYPDRIAMYELVAGVQGNKIKEVLDHIGYERLLTLIYKLPMKFIEPVIAYLLQGLRAEREMH